MKKIIITLFMVATALITTAPADATSGASYTSCDQSNAYFSRVCLDHTTYYGPVIYVYDGNGTQVAAFGVYDCATNIGSRVYFGSEWVLDNSTQTHTNGTLDNIQTYQWPGCSGTNAIGVASASNHDLLEVNAAADIEFVIAN